MKAKVSIELGDVIKKTEVNLEDDYLITLLGGEPVLLVQEPRSDSKEQKACGDKKLLKKRIKRLKECYKQSNIYYEVVKQELCNPIDDLIQDEFNKTVNEYLGVEDYVEYFGKMKDENGFVVDEIFSIIYHGKVKQAVKYISAINTEKIFNDLKEQHVVS